MSGVAKPIKKRTPQYYHLLNNADLRSKVYEPEADSFLFLDALDAEAVRLQQTVVNGANTSGAALCCLEVGPGSGIVLSHLVCHTILATALEAAPSPSTRVPSIVAWAVDVNPYALEATQATFRATLEDLRKEFPAVQQEDPSSAAPTPALELVRGDLASMWLGGRRQTEDAQSVDGHLALRPPEGTFDVVLFNPPYVPTSMEELTRVVSQSSDPNHCIESAWSGGPDGRVVVDRLIQQLPWILRYPSSSSSSASSSSSSTKVSGGSNGDENGSGGVAYIVALEENLIEDLKLLAQTASHEMVLASVLARDRPPQSSSSPPSLYCLQGTVVAARYTGERLRVVRFEWAICKCGQK